MTMPVLDLSPEEIARAQAQAAAFVGSAPPPVDADLPTPTAPNGAPLVSPVQVDNVVRLAVPLHTEDGQTVTALQVRELTGEDEEVIGRAARGTVVRYLQTLVERSVDVGLVGASAVRLRPQTLVNLSIGDRDAVLLATRIVTFGSRFEATWVCQNCRHDNHLVYDLTEDVEWRTGQAFDPSPEVPSGNEVELRRITLADLIFLADMHDGAGPESPAEANTVLLARTLVRYGSTVLAGTGVTVARSMKMKDRAAIMPALLQEPAGPALDHLTYECDACGKEGTYPLGVGALFPGLAADV